MQIDELLIELEKETIPKRIQLLPSGKSITGKDGRTWTVKNAEKLVKDSNDYIQHHPIDENHAVDLSAKEGKSSPAFGWFDNITLEANGEVWADVKWTEKGQKALEKKEYRFISPVFLNNENREITTIARAALTNNPNLSLTSLNSEKSEVKPEVKIEDWEKITQALELPVSATLDDVLQSITPLKQKETEDTTEKVALNAEQITLNAERLAFQTEVLQHKAGTMIDEAVKQCKITPANKERYLNLCMASNETFYMIEEILNNSHAVLLSEPLVPNGVPNNSVALNSTEKSFFQTLGYTQEQWQEIKEFAKKKGFESNLS